VATARSGGGRCLEAPRDVRTVVLSGAGATLSGAAGPAAPVTAARFRVGRASGDTSQAPHPAPSLAVTGRRPFTSGGEQAYIPMMGRSQGGQKLAVVERAGELYEWGDPPYNETESNMGG